MCFLTNDDRAGSLRGVAPGSSLNMELEGEVYSLLKANGTHPTRRSLTPLQKGIDTTYLLPKAFTQLEEGMLASLRGNDCFQDHKHPAPPFFTTRKKQIPSSANWSMGERMHAATEAMHRAAGKSKGNEQNYEDEELSARAREALQCESVQDVLRSSCGGEFRAAFECYATSRSEPKGADCVGSFLSLHKCMKGKEGEFRELLGEIAKNERHYELVKESVERERANEAFYQRKQQQKED